MICKDWQRLLFTLGLSCVLSACVTLSPNAPRSKQDPLESWNRGVYKFNDVIDRGVAKPLARGYVKVIPKPARVGVSNFFANLSTPKVMVNDLLQGKLKAAANDLGRFVMNTTIGLAGLLDPATRAGLDRNEADFGQTLGRWGVHSGPFLELPIFGPSDLRDAPSRFLVDSQFSPLVHHVTNPHHYLVKNRYEKWGLKGIELLDKRAELLDYDDTLKNIYDPYAFIRDAYLQRRAYMMGGKGKEDALPDPDLDADTPPSDAPAAVAPQN